MKFINENPKTIVALGVVGGILIGIGTNNMGVGITLGIVFGVSTYSTFIRKSKEEENPKSVNSLLSQ